MGSKSGIMLDSGKSVRKNQKIPNDISLCLGKVRIPIIIRRSKIEKLANVGTPEALALMTRVKEGEFDASDDECDEWAETPEEINPITELSKHLTGEE